jgi:di/tricarboxylate transporter
MSFEVPFMLVLVGVALVAFVRESFPFEVTALGLLAILVVSGILDVEEALAGFSSHAAVAIGSLFVLSHALTKTGLLETIAGRIGEGAHRRPWPMIVLLLVLVCVGSGVLNNTAVVALSIPLALSLCRRFHLSPSSVLLPLSFASILGGTLTLIGTSTNLLINSVVEDSKQPSLGMFEFTALGSVLAVVGLAYIMLASRRILPARSVPGGLTRKYRVEDFLAELAVDEGSKLVGQSLSHTHINERYGVTVLEVIRPPSGTYLEDVGTVALRHGDVLVVQGDVEDILRLRQEQQLNTLPEVKLGDDQLVAGGQLVEAWVVPGSRMIDRTLKQVDFHHRYGAYVLAIGRRMTTVRTRVAETPLRFGDALLVLIPPDCIGKLEETRDLVVFSDRKASLRKGHLWWLPLVVFPLVLLSAAFGWLDIAAGALVGAVAVLLFRVMTPQEAYRAIDWPVVLVIAAFVPLGHAFQTTGTGDFLAQSVLDLSSWAPPDLHPHVVLALIYVVTALLTQVASNNAAAVVVAPIALSLGPALGVDSRPFVFAVCFAASAAYMTPMGYQTNLMVHTAGEYRFRDYIRFGAPLSLLTWILTTMLIPLIWPFY